MPAGDLLTTPGQIEWDGLLLDVEPSDSGLWLFEGSGVDGFELANESELLPQLVGAGSAAATLPPRLHRVSALGVGTRADEMTVGRTLASSMAPARYSTDLCWYSTILNLPVRSLVIPRRFQPVGRWVNYMQFDIPTVQWTSFNLVNLEWLALDPRVLTVAENPTTLTNGSPETLGNAGSVPAPARFEITGPVTGPQFETDLGVWNFDNYEVPSGRSLVVDARRRTATVLGGLIPVSVVSRAVSATGGTPLWSDLHIAPGGGDVEYTRSSGASTATAVVSDTWA